MRYRVIDDKRLNVYLTRQDLQKENVSIEDIVDGSPETVMKIKKIFSAVSKLTEFDIKNTGLNIVLMPIVDGDLLISACVAEDGELIVSAKNLFVYREFEDVLSAALIISDKCRLMSSLYKFEGKYYLLIEIKKCLQEIYDDLISLISEFGLKSEFSESFIKEHGCVLMKNNAIDIMCDSFF